RRRRGAGAGPRPRAHPADRGRTGRLPRPHGGGPAVATPRRRIGHGPVGHGPVGRVRGATMIPMSLADLAEVVDGTVAEPHAGTRIGPDVVIDSREAGPGALFIALAGERSDGHRHVAAALEAGAAAALVAADRWHGPAELPVVAVADPRTALGRLARHVIDRATGHGLTVVGVTGSMGKTYTKDLLGHVLGTDAPTVAPSSSFNHGNG